MDIQKFGGGRGAGVEGGLSEGGVVRNVPGKKGKTVSGTLVGGPKSRTRKG